jgi:TonB family protein
MSESIEHVLKVSAILLGGLTASALLARRSSALRHWVLTIALGCSLAMPLLSWALPSWSAAPIWRAWKVSISGSESAASERDMRASVAETAAITAGTPEQPSTAVSATTLDIASLAARVWILGSLVSVLLLVIGLARLWWLASRARDIDGGVWLAQGEHLRRSYGLSSPIRLLQSDHSSLLVTWGWRRPKVLLPTAALNWAEDRIRIVLAHELAHIARRDWIAQLAGETLRAVYWFNPLVWILCRRLRMESEHACDDAVLASGIEGSEYAAELLALARSLHPGRQPLLPAPAMARPSSLEGRIHAMLNTTINRQPVSWSSRLATIAALAALTLPVAALRAQTQFFPVTGVVRDSTDRVLPDTRVVLTERASGAKYEVRTDAEGRFAFAGVPPAAYTVEAMRAGFETLKESVQIAGDTERDVRLRVGSLEETITVTGPSVPVTPPDAATLERRADARRRFADSQERENSRCASGGATTSVGGRILQPAKLRDVRPIYPEALQVANIGGVVTMDAIIGTDGNVREVRNVKGPHPDLGAAAADAVRQWQFSTTLLNCEAIDVEMTVTVNFKPQP